VTVKSFRFRILMADLAWAAIAMALSYGLRYQGQWQNPARLPVLEFLPFLSFTILFWTASSSWVHLDGFRGGWRFSAILSQLFPAVLALMLVLFTGCYLARWYASRMILGVFAILFFLGLLGIRILFRGSLESRYRSGAVRKAVIVGSGPIANEIARKIESHPETLWEVSGFLCPAENAHSVSLTEYNTDAVNVRSVGIPEMLRSQGVDDLIISFPQTGHPEISDLITRCRREGIGINVVPQAYELYLSRPRLLDLDGLPLLKLGGVPKVNGYPVWKRVFDWVLAGFLLLISGPFLLSVAAWLKVRKRRAFRSETRCGQFGKTFKMYRLNSDRHAVGLPFHEFVLQQSSFTELPQLINVLQGNMSLVGPRPEGPEKVQYYSDWHRQRLNIRPGMTGLAQVHGLREQNSSEDKTRYDLQYILHRTLFLDISLLLQTISTLALRSFRPAGEAEASPERSGVPMPTTLEESLSRAHSSQSGTD
jgi:lipopolysaccharide/colanic/teichoic acid biosynthesis glycosyltransferase